MKPGYTPKTLEGKLLWLAEESCELAQAISKTLRFAIDNGLTAEEGLHLYNPDVPIEERETNHAWIRREVEDLKAAIDLLESTTIPLREW